MLIVNGRPQEGLMVTTVAARAPEKKPKEQAVAPPPERAVTPAPERAVKPPAEKRTYKSRKKAAS